MTPLPSPSPATLRGLLPSGDGPIRVEPLYGNGSARRFFRVRRGTQTFILLEGPDREENAAYVRLARHLAAREVRVPRVWAQDPGRGWILLEDLGDRSLSGALAGTSDEAARTRLYGPVLALLARFQVAGARGYDASLGFVSEPYGPRLMVEGEGLYFAREFAEDLLGLAPGAGYREELACLAEIGGTADASFLLHRDFQSRNLLLAPEGPAVIDFQGARPGPLAYDAAALILDPYAANSPGLRSRLLADYRSRLADLGADPPRFEDAWFALGSFRLLQALGAFGKLGGRLGKPGFLEHAGTGLRLLAEHLGERGRREVPAVWELVQRSREAWAASRPPRGETGPGAW